MIDCLKEGILILTKTLKVLVLSAIMVAGLSISAHAESEGAGTVTASRLNFRTEPSTESVIQSTADNGTSVLVLETTNDEWYQVYYDGSIGYMASKYLAVTESAAGDFGTAVTSDEEIFLKSEVDIGSDTVGVLDQGTVLTISEVSREWFYVTTEDGLSGFVNSCDVELSIGEHTDFNTDGVVAEAMNYLGVSYVYGGTSPSGFDCSGLVYYIYTNLGYSVNRTASSLMENGVEVEELEPGDLVFFANGGGGRVGHVGIYIGDRQFVHACSGSGKVMISSLDESYYASYYCGARRIITE